MKIKTIKQTVNFKINPSVIYGALLDSKKHSLFTDSKAKASSKVNGKFSAYGGYIEGKNLELVKNKKIVQTWRASDWPEGMFSIVTFLFTKAKTGCTLKFTHEGVPANQYKDLKYGWTEYYWNPIKEMFKK